MWKSGFALEGDFALAKAGGSTGSSERATRPWRARDRPTTKNALVMLRRDAKLGIVGRIY